jgi:hypothetical protein
MLKAGLQALLSIGYCSAQSFLPLSVGNYWEYSVKSVGFMTENEIQPDFKLEVVSDTSINQIEYYKLNSDIIFGTNLIRVQMGEIYGFIQNNDSLIFGFSDEVSEFNSCDPELRDSSVGTYFNNSQSSKRFSSKGCVAVSKEIVFVTNVGIAYFEVFPELAPGSEFTLKGAVINGQEVGILSSIIQIKKNEQFKSVTGIQHFRFLKWLIGRSPR